VTAAVIQIRFDPAKRSGAEIHWDAAADDHAHGLHVADRHLVGHSWPVIPVRSGMSCSTFCSRLPKNVESAINSFDSVLFQTRRT